MKGQEGGEKGTEWEPCTPAIERGGLPLPAGWNPFKGLSWGQKIPESPDQEVSGRERPAGSAGGVHVSGAEPGIHFSLRVSKDCARLC